MRVLHLASEYPPQKVFGLGRFVRDLTVAQARRGDEVTAVTNSLGGEEYEAVRDGVRVCRITFPPPPKPPVSEGQVLQFNVGVVSRALLATDGRPRPNVINAHDWYLLPAADILRKLFSIPLCLTVHDTIVGKALGELTNPGKFIGNVEMWGCRTAERVICCSRFMRDEVVQRYGAQPEHVSVVPCGVDEETFSVRHLEHLAAFREAIARPEERIVLYVGRLDPEKGIELLLEAIPLVLREEPRAKFVVVGTGRLEEKVRAAAQSGPAAGRVLALGYVGPAPLAFLYRCAAVQVAPSLYEPFGIVALEAMVNGVAVVVPDGTGLAEVVEDGEDGLKFPGGSADGLARAVLRLLSDGPLRERLAEEGRQKALRSYGWDRIAGLTDDAYQAAAASGRATS